SEGSLEGGRGFRSGNHSEQPAAKAKPAAKISLLNTRTRIPMPRPHEKGLRETARKPSSQAIHGESPDCPEDRREHLPGGRVEYKRDLIKLMCPRTARIARIAGLHRGGRMGS